MRTAAAPPRSLSAPSRAAALGRFTVEGAGLLLALPLWVWWATWKGGFPAAVWVPGLLYLAACAVTLALAGTPRARWRRGVVVAVASLGALALWAALSLAWASDQGAAWAGGERMLLLAIAFALPVCFAPSRRALLVACLAFPAVATLGGIDSLVTAIAHPGGLVDGRLDGPTSYVNASGALFAQGLVVALVLAARADLAAPARVAMLGLAGPLGAFALMTQSRGVVAASVATLLVVFAFAGQRLRLLGAAAIVGAALAAAAPTLLHVRNAARAGHPVPSLHHAATAVIVLALALIAAGAVYVVVDRRLALRVTPAGARLVRRAARLVLAIAVVAGLAVFVAQEGSPVTWAQARWHDFKTPSYTRLEQADTRFGGGLGSNRYDYWRVAVDVAMAQPLSGAGVENFAEPYLKRRRTLKGPVYAHGIWFEALADLGFPGLLLLAVFVGAVGTAAAGVLRGGRARRVRGERAGGAGVRSGPAPELVAAGLPAAYLLIHGSADWLHAFPVLAVPALGLLGAMIGSPRAGRAASAAAGPTIAEEAEVGAGGRSGASARDGGHGPAPRWPARAVAALAVVAAIASLPVFVAARLLDRANARGPGGAPAALRDFSRAANAEPLAAAPLTGEGIVALRSGEVARARRAFAEASGRDGDNWFPVFMTGIIDARAHRGAAAGELARARRLDPRDPVLLSASAAAASGRPPDPAPTMARVLAEPG